MTDTGAIPGSPRRQRAGKARIGPPTIDRPPAPRLTPPCACGYPLVKTDRECGRCHLPTLWAHTLPPREPEPIDPDLEETPAHA